MKIKYMEISSLIVIFLLLSSCRQTGLLPTPSESTSNQILDSEKGPYQLTRTLTVSTKRLTTLTPTLTPSQTETQTKIPVIPTNELEEFFQNLWYVTDDCVLPCFWGLVPGKTTWQSAEPYLESISYEISTGQREPININNQVYAQVGHGIYIRQSSNLTTNISVLTYDDVIVRIFIPPSTSATHFQMHQLLALLGKPDNIGIFIDELSSTPLDWSFYIMLFLFYPERGVFAYFKYQAIEVNDQWLQTCIAEQHIGPDLTIWATQFPLEREDLENSILGRSLDWKIPPIEDATNMDLDIFYQTFLDSNTDKCLDVSLSVW